MLALWTIYCEEPCVVIWCFGASNQEVIDNILGLVLLECLSLASYVAIQEMCKIMLETLSVN